MGFSISVNLLVSTAIAENNIDISSVGPASVGVTYSCDDSGGAVAIIATVGDPSADAPSATGTQSTVICDGANQSTVIVLTGMPLLAGQPVQVRVALVTSDGTVVSGKNMLATLG